MRLDRILALLLVLACLFFTTGCWDLADINDHIFILGLGIDPDEEPGLYQFTFHYANPRGQASDQSSDTMTYINSTIRSSSLSLAVRELIRNSDSEANFEHLQALVLGSDYLDSMSFDDIDMLFRMASVRRKCVVVTSDIKASDLLSMKFSGMSTAVMINRLSYHYTSADQNIAEGYSLAALYSKREDNLSFSLLSVGAVENSNYTAVSTTDDPKAGDISIAVTGVSIFKNCRYAGRLGYSELETMRLLSESQKDGIISVVSDDSSTDCYQIVSSECRKTCTIKDGKPEFHITLDIECLVMDSGSNTADTEERIEANIRKRIDELILLSRYRYGGELLGLETTLRRSNYAWFESNRSYWDTEYRNSDISISINCRITSSGIIE